MKFHFDDNLRPYTGKELAPLRNYLDYGLLGNSIVAWIGSCRVEFSEMVDGEDVRGGHTIAADKMVHFVLELFDVELATGVVLQRLFAQMIIDELGTKDTFHRFKRQGDDVFFKEKKLNISIATRSINSVLIHIGVNVTNDGTPIATAALSDVNCDAKTFAVNMMTRVSEEWKDILDATYKVRSV